MSESIKDWFKEIESTRFSAELGIASMLRMYLRIMDNQPAVFKLAKVAYENPKNQKIILDRIEELASADFNDQYEHPSSDAFCAYMHILRKVDRHCAIAAARRILPIRNTWWSRNIALEILEIR
jgi:hypothetical protein